MEKEKNKIVLTGTYEGSYEKFRRINSKNKKNKLNIIKLFLRLVKK